MSTSACSEPIARLGHTIGGRWLLERVLGEGGMAAVYAARDVQERPAAVKILHAELGSIAEIRDRFLREGYVANAIRHPGAVEVLEHGVTGHDGVYLMMELLHGESLAQRMTRPLPADELLGILDQVLDTLVQAHAQGIVHRDLKPDTPQATSGLVWALLAALIGVGLLLGVVALLLLVLLLKR